MSAKSDRRAARETVAAYHEEQLGELVRRVKLAIERFQAGEIDAFEVDEVIFQYSRAAKELWKFCNMGHVESPRESSGMNRPATGGIAGRVGDGDRVVLAVRAAVYGGGQRAILDGPHQACCTG